MRKTKLVMTLGPALMQGDRLREALKVADAVRINASHGDPVTRGEALEHGGPGLALVAAGEQRHFEPGRRRQFAQGLVMLAGQQLGRRHQGGLVAGFDGVEHGHQGDDGLAAADVALEQPQHPPLRRHVGVDFGQRLLLAGGQAIGQGGQHLGA